MLKAINHLLMFVFFSVIVIGSGILSSPVFSYDDCFDHQTNHSHSDTETPVHHDSHINNHHIGQDDCQDFNCSKNHPCECCIPHLFQQPIIEISSTKPTKNIIYPILTTFIDRIIYYNSAYLDISQPPD